MPSFRTRVVALIAVARAPLLVYLILHAGLFAFDLYNPDAIMRGDRTGSRLELIEQVRQAGPAGLGPLFLATGLPGDYLEALPIYLVLGPYGVIVFQVLAGVATLLFTVALARSLGACDRAAAGAGLLYCMLPGSLMDPHLLVTESFYTVFFIGGLWAMTHAARSHQRGDLWLGAFLLILAAWVRPQALPFGLVAAAALAWAVPRLRWDALAAPLLMLVLFPGLWILWRYLETGGIGLGPSSFDIPVNLRIRADRLALVAQIPGWVQSDLTHPSRTSPAEFMNLAARYPRALLSTYLSDAVNFAGNPGANAVFGRYLGFYAPMTDLFFWKHTMDSGGFPAVARAIIGGNSRLVLAILVTSVVHAVLVIGAAAGTWRVIGLRPVRVAAAVVLLVCLAQTLVVFVSGLVRWSHRAPLEPALAALAGIGIAWILRRPGERPAPVAGSEVA